MSAQKEKQEIINNAIEQYGGELVSRALDIVYMSDPDSAYTMLEDQGMHEEAEVVYSIFFEEAY